MTDKVKQSKVGNVRCRFSNKVDPRITSQHKDKSTKKFGPNK